MKNYNRFLDKGIEILKNDQHISEVKEVTLDEMNTAITKFADTIEANGDSLVVIANHIKENPEAQMALAKDILEDAELSRKVIEHTVGSGLVRDEDDNGLIKLEMRPELESRDGWLYREVGEYMLVLGNDGEVSRFATFDKSFKKVINNEPFIVDGVEYKNFRKFRQATRGEKEDFFE